MGPEPCRRPKAGEDFDLVRLGGIGKNDRHVQRALRPRNTNVIDAGARRHRRARNEHHVALADRRKDFHPFADEMVAQIVHFGVGDHAAVVDLGIDLDDAALAHLACRGARVLSARREQHRRTQLQQRGVAFGQAEAQEKRAGGDARDRLAGHDHGAGNGGQGQHPAVLGREHAALVHLLRDHRALRAHRFDLMLQHVDIGLGLVIGRLGDEAARQQVLPRAAARHWRWPAAIRAR